MAIVVLQSNIASGKAVMLDAYCPHMGTHLGKNKTSHTVVRGQHVGRRFDSLSVSRLAFRRRWKMPRDSFL